MSVFGWSYPPGAANDPNAPYNQTDMPCGVCGRDVDHCICPECPVCESQGDPACYDGAVKCSWCGIRAPSSPDCGFCTEDGTRRLRELTPITKENVPTHGMVRSQAQIDSLAAAQAAWEADAAAYNPVEEEIA